jgi:CrcB protein
MDKVVLVFLGGGLGAAVRFATVVVAARLFGTAFPWGTMVVNLVGCFLVGLLFALAERYDMIGPSARLFFMTGFLGGLTTFSAYGLETVNAARAGASLLVLLNVVLHNVAGLSLVGVGMVAARLIR